MRTLLALVLMECCLQVVTSAQPVRPDIGLYDEVLHRYVTTKGEVHYGALSRDLTSLNTFVQQLAEVSPHSHPELFGSRQSRLAYWLNTYNALVLWAFAEDYPKDKSRLEGLLGRGLFFYRRKFEVGGKRHTLSGIENDIIRAEFQEPRIHFALVCASASCPWLSQRAYTADNLERLLETQATQFINQNRNVSLDSTTGVVRLSKIFKWYRKDFGADAAKLLAYIARYRRTDGTDLVERKWKINYAEYDWSLNEHPQGRQ